MAAGLQTILIVIAFTLSVLSALLSFISARDLVVNSTYIGMAPTKRKAKIVSYTAGGIVSTLSAIGYILLAYGVLPAESSPLLFRPLFIGLIGAYIGLVLLNSSS